MNRFVNAALIAVVVSVCPTSLLAQLQKSQQPPAAGSPKISACSLVTKDEVKRHLPWISALDGIAVEEESIGKSGSSCNYPSVFIQVLPFSQKMIDLARKKGGALYYAHRAGADYPAAKQDRALILRYKQS